MRVVISRNPPCSLKVPRAVEMPVRSRLLPVEPFGMLRIGGWQDRFRRSEYFWVLASLLGRNTMHFEGRLFRSGLAVAGLAFAVLFSTGAEALNFSFRFSGNMSCMRPVPVSNAPISGSGTGTLNPDGSVTAEVSQTLLVFSTSLRFDSKLGPRVTPVPGGTGQVRVAGKQSLKFIWNLPNNTLIVTVNVRGQSCSAAFQANLHGGKTEYTFFDGSGYHYCGRPVMTSSSCEVR